MQAFDDYWNQPQPYLQSVTVKIIADPQARLANLQSGSVDAVDALALSDVARLQSDPTLQIVSYPPGGTWYANVLNLAASSVRQQTGPPGAAISASTARRSTNSRTTAPGRRPSAAICRTTSGTTRTPPTKYTFDLDQAKSLLQQAGMGEWLRRRRSASAKVCCRARRRWRRSGRRIWPRSASRSISAEGAGAVLRRLLRRQLRHSGLRTRGRRLRSGHRDQQ